MRKNREREREQRSLTSSQELIRLPCRDERDWSGNHKHLASLNECWWVVGGLASRWWGLDQASQLPDISSIIHQRNQRENKDTHNQVGDGRTRSRRPNQIIKEEEEIRPHDMPIAIHKRHRRPPLVGSHCSSIERRHRDAVNKTNARLTQTRAVALATLTTNRRLIGDGKLGVK